MAAGRITLWGAGELLTTFFQGGVGAPRNFWLALCKNAAPNPYVSGAELDEPLVGSYQRLKIPAEATHWDNAGQMHVISMTKDLSFTTPVEDWGTVKYWALCSDETEGYVYAIGSLKPVYITHGEPVTIYSGDLTFTVGPFFSDKDT